MASTAPLPRSSAPSAHPGWEGVDPARLPCHVAVIMDGNRRWARERHLPPFAGHAEGREALRELVKACRELGIPFLTVYAFSTENWRRSPDEVAFLWGLFEDALLRESRRLRRNGVRLRCIGDTSALSPKLRDLIARAEALTADGRELLLQVAVNYGGRQDILRATQAAMRAAANGELAPEALTEERFARMLATGDQPDPDLLIRTSGEQRLSNYLLWQLAYAELHVTPVYWPAFGREHLRAALLDFQGRNRRFGADTPSPTP